tara:strand:+ start:3512 stop:4258 length:747 start_codon:yes stop_codon:yes gene_type:complete
MEKEIEKIQKIIDDKRKEIERRNKKQMDNQKRFYNQKIIGNNLLNFGKEIEKYQNEIKTIENKNMFWISWEYYQNLIFDPKNMRWRIIPICSCLPTNKPENMIWITNCERFIPKIYNFVKSLKNVKSAVISRMGKNVKLHLHQGWECIANHILRSHLTIIVEENKSGLIVNNEKKYHNAKEYILFDDSINHTGFNESENDRYILIIDFKRPKEAMKGISKIQPQDGLDLEVVRQKFQKINKYYGNLKY